MTASPAEQRLQSLAAVSDHASTLSREFPAIQLELRAEYNKTGAAVAAVFAALVSYSYKPMRGRPLASIIVTLIVGGMAYLLSKKTVVANRAALNERDQQICRAFGGVAILLRETWQQLSARISQQVNANKYTSLDNAETDTKQCFLACMADYHAVYGAAAKLALADLIDESAPIDGRARLTLNRILLEAKRLAYGEPWNTSGERPYVSLVLCQHHPCQAQPRIADSLPENLCPKGPEQQT